MPTHQRIALITGANRGIGRSTALHLARDGVDVVITFREHADEAEAVVAESKALGRRAAALPLDLADTASFPVFAGELSRVLAGEWGRQTFDHLVNNGGFSRGGMIADVTEEDVDALFAAHFKGTLFLTQALLPLLADGGSIVNLSSGLARFTFPQRAAYGSIKGAVEVLTRYMAAELGPRGITANVVAPGAVATDFSGGRLRDDRMLQEHIAEQTPLGRHAVADDIGPVIANLLRPGNGWMTGQRIEVAGGMHL
jgi:NAD(P)-dependent dehydrogenase (short-subunit alcohol dehydrogenase family)